MAKNITIYSTPTCPYCVMAKNYLEDKGISFMDVDVSTNQEAAKEMVEKSGQMGVPVIDVDGKIMVGFDAEKLDEMIGQ